MNKLDIGAIIISGKCDYGCVFCDAHNMWKELEDPASIKEMEKQVAENIQAHLKSGKNVIEISGNDPGEYPDILNLIRYIKTFDQFEHVILSTNGVRSSSMLNELEEAGLSLLRFPVYGHSNQLLSKTAKRGESIIEIKKILNESPISLNPRIGVTKYNHDHLVDILEFILENENENIYRIDVDRIYPSTAHTEYFASMDEIRPSVEKLYQYIQKNKKKMPSISISMENCLIDHSDKIFHAQYGPDMGSQQYNDKLKTEIDSVPNYRIRTVLDSCKQCAAYLDSRCSGMLKREYEMFGDLTKPIK